MRATRLPFRVKSCPDGNNSPGQGMAHCLMSVGQSGPVCVISDTAAGWAASCGSLTHGSLLPMEGLSRIDLSSPRLQYACRVCI